MTPSITLAVLTAIALIFAIFVLSFDIRFGKKEINTIYVALTSLGIAVVLFVGLVITLI